MGLSEEVLSQIIYPSEQAAFAVLTGLFPEAQVAHEPGIVADHFGKTALPDFSIQLVREVLVEVTSSRYVSGHDPKRVQRRRMEGYAQTTQDTETFIMYRQHFATVEAALETAVVLEQVGNGVISSKEGRDKARELALQFNESTPPTAEIPWQVIIDTFLGV